MTPSPVARLATAAAARPRLVAALGLLLTLAAGLFAFTHFAMNTDTYALIAPRAAWRQDEAHLRAAFPANGDTIVAVVDGATPELAETAASALAARLSGNPHFRLVTRPDGGPFFAREGLLYGSLADVRTTTQRMIAAQPLLGPLATDPSLRGIAGALGTIADGVVRGDTSLAQTAGPMGALARALDAQASGHPAFFSWARLIAGNGALGPRTRRIVVLTPHLDYAALMPGEAATDAVRAATATLHLTPANGVTVRLTGEVPLGDEEFRSLESNIGAVGAVMAAAMLTTLWLATRSARTVLAIMLTTIAGLVITTAVGLAAVGRFNIISIAFIPLFVGLGIDFSIQLATRFRAERSPPRRGEEGDLPRNGEGDREAVEGCAHTNPSTMLRMVPLPVSGETDIPASLAVARAATALGPSLLLAAAAVALGFCAFLPTDYVGISELGIIAGLGMVVALLLAVTFLPALLILLDPPASAAPVGWPGAAPLDRWLLRRRRAVLWAFGVAMIGSIAALPFVEFDFNPLHLRDAHSEAVATLTDLMHDPDTTPNTIDILAPDLAQANTLAARLGKLPEVRAAVTLDSLVPADQTPKLAAIADANALLSATLDPFEVAAPPTDADRTAALASAAAHLTAAAERDPAHAGPARRLAAAFTRLANGPAPARADADALLATPLKATLAQLTTALAAGHVTRATLPPALARDWVAPDGRARVSLFPAGDAEDNAVLARFARAVLAVAPHATGAPVTIQAAARSISDAFVTAGCLALAGIALLLFAILRSVREVAFTLAPVALAGFLTLATCVLIGQRINFANIIAFPLLFGVGVAFHIYFVMAWRGGATDLLQSPLARAVFFSALATGSAFGSVWLSAHPGTASMGKILMLSLAWTLVCALIFEPALLGPPRALRNAGAR